VEMLDIGTRPVWAAFSLAPARENHVPLIGELAGTYVESCGSFRS